MCEMSAGLFFCLFLLMMTLGVNSRPSTWEDIILECSSHRQLCTNTEDCCPQTGLTCANGECLCLPSADSSDTYRWFRDRCLHVVNRSRGAAILIRAPVDLPPFFRDNGIAGNGEGEEHFVVSETRTAPILGFAVFVTIIFFGSLLSVVYLRVKQREIVARRRSRAMAAEAPSAPPDPPPSYDDVVAGDQPPPQYKSVALLHTL